MHSRRPEQLGRKAFQLPKTSGLKPAQFQPPRRLGTQAIVPEAELRGLR